MTLDTPKIDRLAWLEGAWTGSAFGGTIEEVFSSASGGVVLGTSRVVSNGKLSHREFINITELDGSMIYEVHLPKRDPHVFKLEKIEDKSVVWADPANEWPKRISYTRTGDTIDVVLEGDTGGRVVKFTMRKK